MAHCKNTQTHRRKKAQVDCEDKEGVLDFSCYEQEPLFRNKGAERKGETGQDPPTLGPGRDKPVTSGAAPVAVRVGKPTGARQGARGSPKVQTDNTVQITVCGEGRKEQRGAHGRQGAERETLERHAFEVRGTVRSRREENR